MKDKLPTKFENAKGECKMECVLFDVNEQSGKTDSIERIRVV